MHVDSHAGMNLNYEKLKYKYFWLNIKIKLLPGKKRL